MRLLSLFMIGTAALVAAASIQTATAGTRDIELLAMLADVRGMALKEGVSSTTFDRVTADLERDPAVVELSGRQAEFEQTTGQYVRQRVSAARIETGRRQLEQHAALLARIEKAFGVDRRVVVAVWGLESNYGAFPGNRPVIRSLATLAVQDLRRTAYWRRELVGALKLIERGDVAASDMVGSWAGALGHTQFMPTTFDAYAIDFDGDGRRDLLGSQADALASTARFLARYGWRGVDWWGLEVTLPSGFDYALSSPRAKAEVDVWRRRGVRPANGQQWPGELGDVRLVVPAGAGGPAFLVGTGFRALLRYNPALSYALSVALLADRIGGAPELVKGWPKEERALSKAERQELQQRLASAGYEPGPIDGMIGGLTRAAIQSYQGRVGILADGYPSLSLLSRLRLERSEGVSSP